MDAYQRIRERGEVIESLDQLEGRTGPTTEERAASRKPTRRKPQVDPVPILDEIVQQVEKLRGAEDPLQAKAFGLLRATASLARAAANPEDSEELSNPLRKAKTAFTHFVTAYNRSYYGD